MAKAPEQGLRDPFNKWGIGKGVEEAADIVAPVKAAQAQITELVKMLARPGLNREARVTLSRELAEKRKQLKTLELDAKRTAKDFQSQKNMQVEILYKLSGIRSQMARKDLGPDVLKTLIASEKRLEDLYKASKNTKSVEALQELLKSVKETQASLEALPDDVADALNENDEIMQKVLDRQDEARKYLKEQKESFKKFRSDLKDKFISLGMDIADRLGVGKLNLGNVLRGIGAVWRAGSWGVKAAKSGLKTIQALNLVRKSPDALAERERSHMNEKPPSETIAEKFSQYVADTRVFHRRSLQLMKGKNTQSGKLLIGPLLDKLKNFLSFLPGFLARKLPIPVPTGAAASIAGALAAAKNALVAAAPTIGAAMVPAVIAGALAYMGKKEKDRIEANPNAPEFKDNPYAMTLRHEAKSLRQAGAMNQRKALKTLPPGVAMQYLEAGIQENGTYLDGYSKSQLLAMAAGKAVDLSPEQNADWGSESRRTPVSQLVDGPKAAVATANAVPLPNNLDLMDIPEMVPPPVTSMAKKPTEGPGRMGSAGPSSARVRDNLGSLFVATGGVKLDQLNPKMQRNMVAMAQEYYEKTGKRLQINDAFRTYQDQEEMYRKKPKGQAAPPGRSIHEYGLAFDTQSDQGDELSRLGLLSKYGFSRPVKGERWHIQPKGVDLAVAKSGIYSGDAPVNSGVAVPQAVAVSETEGRMPMPKVSSPQQTSKAAQAKPNSVVQPSTRLGIADIPTFDMSAGSLMAMNLGVVG